MLILLLTIWCFPSDDSLIVESLLELVDRESIDSNGIPSPAWPSDHIALIASFRLGPPSHRGLSPPPFPLNPWHLATLNWRKNGRSEECEKRGATGRNEKGREKKRKKKRKEIIQIIWPVWTQNKIMFFLNIWEAIFFFFLALAPLI